MLRALLRASEIMAGSLEFRESLDRLARLMVDDFADICLIDIFENGAILRQTALHRDPELQPLVDELRDRYAPIPGGAHPAAGVLAGEGVEWREEMNEEFLRATTHDDRHYDLVRTLKFSSFLCVPIEASGEVLGAMTLIRTPAREPFRGEVVELVVDMARRAAVHLSNARLFEARNAAEAALRNAVDQLRRLQQLTDLALAALPLDEFINEVIHRVQRILGADTVRVLLATEDERSLKSGGGVGLETGEWRDNLPVGRGFSGRISATRQPLMLRPRTANFELLSPALRELEFIAGVPLLAGDRLIGVLHIGSRTHAFDENDLQLLLIAADRIAIALDQTQRFDLERRKTVALQEALLPSELGRISCCTVAARYWPADATAVGGDFYDVFSLPDSRGAVLIGDISGKGVAAAAFTGLARHTIRTAARHTDRIEAPLRWLHEAMLDTRGPEYCTALYGTFTTLEPGRVRFEFAAGGHPLPMLVRANGTIETIGVPGTVLGVIPDVRFTPTTIDLVPGDIVILYTDGMTDTRDHPLDDAALGQLFVDALDVEPDRMIDSIDKAIRALRKIQEDDIALLIIGVDDPDSS